MLSLSDEQVSDSRIFSGKTYKGSELTHFKHSLLFSISLNYFMCNWIKVDNFSLFL